MKQSKNIFSKYLKTTYVTFAFIVSTVIELIRALIKSDYETMTPKHDSLTVITFLLILASIMCGYSASRNLKYSITRKETHQDYLKLTGLLITIVHLSQLLIAIIMYLSVKENIQVTLYSYLEPLVSSLIYTFFFCHLGYYISSRIFKKYKIEKTVFTPTEGLTALIGFFLSFFYLIIVSEYRLYTRTPWWVLLLIVLINSVIIYLIPKTKIKVKERKVDVAF